MRVRCLVTQYPSVFSRPRADRSLLLFVWLDLGMSFLAPEGELSSGFVHLDFLRKVSRKNWPSVFSVCKPLAGLHLPQPWERKPDHSKRGTSWLFFSLWQNTKHHHPFPRLLLCHCKHCHGFGGKGKLFCVCVNQHFDRQGKLQSNSKL